MRRLLGVIGLVWATSAMGGDFPRESAAGSEDGRSAPFIGQWSMGMPDGPDVLTSTQFVSCDQPLTIEAADDTHIRYLGPRNESADPAIELRAFAGRTSWIPIAGGPSYIAVWIDANSFYLYDVGPTGEADWNWPYIYRRCP